MYKVRFTNDEPVAPIVEVFASPSIEDAVAFALTFHRSSNVAHIISVSDEDKESVIFRRSSKSLINDRS